MIELSAKKNALRVLKRELLTSGSVNVNEVQFQFDADWDGLNRTAVFQAGECIKPVILDDSNKCSIPWEVLQVPRVALYAGVYGTNEGGDVVLPTVWASLGEVKQGATCGEETQPPTPELYDQILGIAKNAESIAKSVRDDADAGEFDGEPGKNGAEGPPGPSGVVFIDTDEYGVDWGSSEAREAPDGLVASLTKAYDEHLAVIARAMIFGHQADVVVTQMYREPAIDHTACSECDGSGTVNEYAQCPRCYGTGTIENPVDVDVPCHYCNGTGTDEAGGPCPSCGGTGTVTEAGTELGTCPECSGTGSASETIAVSCPTCGGSGYVEGIVGAVQYTTGFFIYGEKMYSATLCLFIFRGRAVMLTSVSEVAASDSQSNPRIIDSGNFGAFVVQNVFSMLSAGQKSTSFTLDEDEAERIQTEITESYNENHSVIMSIPIGSGQNYVCAASGISINNEGTPFWIDFKLSAVYRGDMWIYALIGLNTSSGIVHIQLVDLP